MGKLLIIIILVMILISVFIITSVQDKAQESPELLSNNLIEIETKALSREALKYGMNKINESGVSVPLNYTETFTDFNVLEGSIDSIKYTSNAMNDSIEIISYASYQNGNDTFHHKSSALVAWVPENVQAAITANSSIVVTGSATVVGDIIQNSDPPLSFEEVFGITKEEMLARADIVINNPGNNPSCLDSLGTIWINGYLKTTNDSFDESGILIVDGDAKFSGGNFSGVMWITGDLDWVGNNYFEGAIYVEGGITIEGDPLILGGNVYTVYNLGAITAAFDDLGLTQTLRYKLDIVSLFEDDDL
ncbi:MAG: hypothetical protein P9M11_08720 [Candidatus Tenebribacter burtonii]|nr:hypothetical protein [Candidatus Tenebribacter burtonii]